MKTDETVNKMQAAVKEFAAGRIAPAQLYKAEEFPMELWKAMGEAGLLGIGVPKEFGGQGGGYTDIARCGRILGAAGHSLGLTVSWMLHLAAAKFLIMNMGSREQKEDLLPKLAKGEMTMSLSISEPKTGAHPKHMKTRALFEDGSYVISGEKAYLTNGPIAGMYAVIAVTEEKEGKKQFTAFLVPRETPGLTVGENMALDFFKPSPHGGIVLEACKVPESAVLGPFNQGYETIVKAFRDTEDILMMGPVCGGMDRIGELLAEQLKKAGAPSDDKLEALGLYLSLCKGLFALALYGAEKLEKGEPDPDLAMIPVSFRFMSKKALKVALGILEDVNPEEGSELAVTLHDLIFSGRIAGNVSKIKQKMMGKAALI